MKDLTPKKMVEIFDQYVYGQRSAKAILAVAMRNRWRLTRMPKDQRLAVVKQNILLSGPTGSGKTALMRVLKNHFGLPVLEIDITQYTETGYVGKEVTSILDDLFGLDIVTPEWYKVELKEQQRQDQIAEAKRKEAVSFKSRDEPTTGGVSEYALDPSVEMSAAVKIVLLYMHKLMHGVAASFDITVDTTKTDEAIANTVKYFTDEKFREEKSQEIIRLRTEYPDWTTNALASHTLKALFLIRGASRRKNNTYVGHMFPAWESSVNGYTEWDTIVEWVGSKFYGLKTDKQKHAQLRKLINPRTPIMRFRAAVLGKGVFDAFSQFDNLTSGFMFSSKNKTVRDDVSRKFIEDYGVIFVDEIDKLAEAQGESSGRDRISRTGVQRSLLKALEGEETQSRNTTNILWVGAGSFANAPISGLMPEIQGRMPLRAVIEPLDKAAYCNILKLPTSVFHSSKGLLEVEGIEVIYDEGTFEHIAKACEVINKGTDDLGARRLGDIVYEAFMKPFFDPEQYKDGYDISGKKLKWLVEHYQAFVDARKNVLTTTVSD